MRRLLISTFVSLASIIPALAQDAPQGQPVAPNAAPDQNDPLKDATQAIQQRIQARLASAGFTEIQMVPNSFLISAKDKDGRSVTMMASPSSITKFEDPGRSQDSEQDDGPDSDMPPSDQPSTTGQGLIDDI
jgi:hypothetical protein